MTQDQIRKQREQLIIDLKEVIDNHRTDLGTSLMATDVIGVLEWIKIEYFFEINQIDF